MTRDTVEIIVEVVLLWLWRALIIVFTPYLVFWAIGIFVPSWSIEPSSRTIGAFWILYLATRMGVQTIRFSDWETPARVKLPE